MNRKFGKRLFSGLLALCVAAMIPLSVSAQTVAEIQAEQDRLQAEKDQLEAQLEQLRNDDCRSRLTWCSSRSTPPARTSTI